ncbi:MULTISPECIES: esterase-like activity of phytase family protein [unclassified Polaromonas]|uniref:esterase-like activity of phytase family protein n=1 Tax=unclassified Polaromonas TaxID=2638319 RepID=UPI000F082F90|nr:MULTISPECIES: esterase-like activity of phytase family protein [unclassified Polaromonas]AYQ27382.1 esterase-like activity of phytase family protein [Polaromonas sp. SP1]QGJ17777.1 esterase-like activity of phytase family protein [Polaromonas sp. Pch-P]
MDIPATSLSRRRLVLGTAAAAVLGLTGCRARQPVAAPDQPPRTRLRLIGESRFAHRLQFQGTTVGGLSGIDYDAANDLYYLISDDGSSINPARFYTARIALGMDSLGPPELLGVTTLRQADGSAYPSSALQGRQVPDPESIRWRAGSRTVLWTSEGHALTGAAPALRETRPDGTLVREFSLPAMFDFQLTQGPRGNLTLEGLALTPDGKTAWLAMENALREDGPVPTVLAPGGPCRFTQIDLATGKALRQIAYVPDAIPRAARPPTAHADNGVVEILMLDADRMLVLERAYMAGWGPDTGNSLRLYLVDTRQGSDTLATPVLQPGAYRAVDKTLMADFSAFTGPGAGPRLERLDNTEGMAWGPVLPNGNRSLVFISDDNFSSRQISQWLAFEFLD